ncbi:MAG: hypothetical protein II038_06540, partial [Lachnospiraceae bacterium]|nr:hypothetical protein [Lachnospiraceae bacterium]
MAQKYVLISITTRPGSCLSQPNNQALTQDMQRSLMKEWIAGDSYMSKHRGEYYKRYADNLPFEHHFDI